MLKITGSEKIFGEYRKPLFRLAIMISIGYLIGGKEILIFMLFLLMIPVGFCTMLVLSVKLDEKFCNRMPGIHFGQNIGG
ncbi:MAG: hypothetical protein PHS92_05435 [Candidatus Gracilibacteria bacterium]|nr:hypothetical protein [Candidatus Gracilibacteria bacterium]